MTAIIYCEECGLIHDVDEGGVGTGTATEQMYDSPDEKSVLDTLLEYEIEYTDEFGIAVITMSTYDGPLSDHELYASGAGIMASGGDGRPLPCENDDCNHPYLTRFIMLVEVADEEQRLLQLSCDSCGFEPEDASDWVFDVVERSWCTEHQFLCPECIKDHGADAHPDGSHAVVWSEHFDIDDELVTTTEDDYEMAKDSDSDSDSDPESDNNAPQ